jgi:hypothetical protein
VERTVVCDLRCHSIIRVLDRLPVIRIRCR